ncbi:MAG: hypothetical protein LUC18_01695, partial [Porphyromonadaceae bacterium]|nr:hypothetical protein [Porphyromonadaceae bacterium]
LQQQHREKIYSQMGREGKQNMAVVESYCEANGVDMEKIFPEFACAKSLGEEWFIPGDREAEYYANIIGYGVGEENGFRMRDKDATKHVKSLVQKAGKESEALTTYLDLKESKIYLPQVLFSSTMQHGDITTVRQAYKHLARTKYDGYYFSTLNLVYIVRGISKFAAGEGGTMKMLRRCRYSLQLVGSNKEFRKESHKFKGELDYCYCLDIVPDLPENLGPAILYPSLSVRPCCEF